MIFSFPSTVGFVFFFNQVLDESSSSNYTWWLDLNYMGLDGKIGASEHQPSDILSAEFGVALAVEWNVTWDGSLVRCLHGCRHSLPDGLMRVADAMVDGEIIFAAG
ncbi:hypothetical protein MKW98_020783 [Papaver atlanticum]|uniref:Uncharacterized protein n=1 Tax=Papaver atlanticum TaxID=357466 RepID=A0AAD4TJV9_9MAGN|nr:hypothetical protein MKW98_020783 [Papaver atlanticum]